MMASARPMHRPHAGIVRADDCSELTGRIARCNQREGILIKQGFGSSTCAAIVAALIIAAAGAAAAGAAAMAQATGASLPGGASSVQETFDDWRVACTQQDG